MAFSIILILSMGFMSYGKSIPEQIHLSLTGDPTQMAVTWLTQKSIDSKPYIYYGQSPDQLTQSVPASIAKWTDGGSKSITRFTYRGIIPDLKPGQKYYYSVGSDDEKSDVFNFTQIDPSKELRVAIFGDFSILNGYSLSTLIEMTQLGELDIVFHIGDISYDLDDKNGDNGDDFMNAIQPITVQVPYMVVAGNHEQSQDFLHYKNRFTMPQNGILDDNEFWSFTCGNFHFIGISSEYYGFNMSSEAQLQFDWLNRDLEASANAAWRILFMHRPMYCSDKHKSGCHDLENVLPRNGAPGFPALEPLFNKMGVDAAYWAHKHTYERYWPMINGTVLKNGQQLDHYHNSLSTVYTLTGAAGCHDHVFPNETIAQPFSAVRLGNYGFILLTIHNNTHLSTVFVDALEPSNRLDPFTLSKDEGYRPNQ